MNARAPQSFFTLPFPLFFYDEFLIFVGQGNFNLAVTVKICADGRLNSRDEMFRAWMKGQMEKIGLLSAFLNYNFCNDIPGCFFFCLYIIFVF